MKKLYTHEIERISEEEFKEVEKNKIVVVLDNIRSMHNVGAAFRTSDAFLIEKIILGGVTAQPPQNEIHKTALGAENTVDWQHFETIVPELLKYKQMGYQIISVEQAEGSVQLHDFKRKKEDKICLVFGNEVFGVNEEIIAISDYCLEIPQYGTKHSFNVSVSMGIVLWQLLGVK